MIFQCKTELCVLCPFAVNKRVIQATGTPALIRISFNACRCAASTTALPGAMTLFDISSPQSRMDSLIRPVKGLSITYMRDSLPKRSNCAWA